MLRSVIALSVVLAAPAAAKTAKPLFEASDVLSLTFKGPVGKASDRALPGTLTLGAETYPITFTERGITRRASDVCPFAPLRVSFTQPPPATSVFAGQKHLKLVTHCRSSEDFQQHVLLEHAVYKMYNRLTPMSFRTRLLMLSYVGDNNRPIATRYGFFIEDTDDMAKRNGLKEPKTADRISANLLSPTNAARVALFQHMLGNHDWSMRAGPQGAGCCHNGKLIGPLPGSTLLVPVPYDFDFSGFVDAPYATPPDQLKIADVRQRLYRGYCAHNPQALRAAAEMNAAKGDLMGIVSSTPGLQPKARDRALAYMQQFFAEIASDETMRAKVFKTCL